MEASPEASAEKRRETIQQFSAAARNALESSEALWENLPRAPKVILSNRSAGMPRVAVRPPLSAEKAREVTAAAAARLAGIAAREAAASAKAAAAKDPPREEREGLLPEGLQSARRKREYRYPAHDLIAETEDWDDFQRGKINRNKWLHLTIKDLVDNHGLVEELELLIGWSQDWYQRDNPNIKEMWKRIQGIRDGEHAVPRGP